MTYSIVLEKPAQKFLKRLSKEEKSRILKALQKLPKGDVKAMQGYRGYYRLRVGDYRVIYTIDNGELLIMVIDVGNRGDIYKRY